MFLFGNLILLHVYIEYNSNSLFFVIYLYSFFYFIFIEKTISLLRTQIWFDLARADHIKLNRMHRFKVPDKK